jgi:phospholipid-binding lipoprotein MlaA
VRNTGTVLRLLDARASVLDASDLIEGAALDRYEFVRDAYLQRRESKINDGESPRSKGDSTAPGQNPDSKKPGGSADNDVDRVGPTIDPTPDAKPAGKADGKSSSLDTMEPDTASVVEKEQLTNQPALPVVASAQ